MGSFQDLTLPPAERVNVSLVGRQEVQQVVPFLDVAVDGTSLRTMISLVGYGDDFVTPLSPRWGIEYVEQTVKQLLLGNGVSDEQVDMLVCPVCADRDCGAVMLDVTVNEREVVWSNWQWTNYDPAGGKKLDLPVMRFQPEAYNAALSSAAATMAALPYVEPVAPRFLWPWQWGWGLPRRDR